MSHTTNVSVGQKYKDNDARANFPFLEVLELSGHHAICQRGPRRVRIRQDRLAGQTNRRGYRLLEGAEATLFTTTRSANGARRDAKPTQT